MIFALIFIALAVGIAVGFFLPISIPLTYAKYVSVSLLAGLDSVLGAFRAGRKEKFNFVIFSTGFISNALLAAFLTLLGDRLGVDLYIAAIVVFGGRIFNNLAFIRRDLLTSIAQSGRPAPQPPSKTGTKAPSPDSLPEETENKATVKNLPSEEEKNNKVDKQIPLSPLPEAGET